MRNVSKPGFDWPAHFRFIYEDVRLVKFGLSSDHLHGATLESFWMGHDSAPRPSNQINDSFGRCSLFD